MDEKDKKDYEASFLIREEEVLKSLFSSVSERGGEITFEGTLNRVALAYPIEKSESASFGYFHFKATPDTAKALKEDFSKMDKVLRFMIVTPPFSKRENREPNRELKRFTPERKPSIVVEKSSVPLTNEALEKKIEEILQ